MYYRLYNKNNMTCYFQIKGGGVKLTQFDKQPSVGVLKVSYSDSLKTFLGEYSEAAIINVL